MLEVQPKDSRDYFMLPQAPESAGYYVYGTPGNGASQYANPRLLTIIFAVEREWQLLDTRQFGIGNISLAGGIRHKDHNSHMKGLEVDVRPLRKDGLHRPVRYFDSGYDRAATERLINIFRSNAPGSIRIYFNDNRISGVQHRDKHDNHFHFEIS
ncbi:hypothetical protein [Massilia sp. YIM B04103]|uniref:hypothetical protein n=1 Tax=Massilia sp. YIM B04103 TaxID=2963106 RepID=UPI00210C141A|nr:hypothetical protein [Massilia sp. YIM B04103]